IRYVLTEKNEWKLVYEAETDAPTIVNPTNHVYFNLTGGKQSILSHLLKIQSETFLPLNDENVPTGEKLSVSGTPFDFMEGKEVKSALCSSHPQIKLANGLDHPFLLKKNSEQPA